MSGKTSTARVEEGISLQQRTIFKTEQVPSCRDVRVNSRSHREVNPFLPEQRTLGFTVSATTAGADGHWERDLTVKDRRPAILRK